MRTINATSWRHALYTVLGVLQWIAGVMSVFISASLKAPSGVGEFWGFGGAFLKWSQTWAWLAAPLLVVLIPVLHWMRVKVGVPWTWSAIHDVLDQFQNMLFKAASQDEAPHHNRVTLFKYRRWVWRRMWPWTGWLAPVERSGHTTRKCGTAFRTPDDADAAEGVAGQTWARNRVLEVAELPDVESRSRDPKVLADYAKQTWVTEGWVRNNQPRSRSFCGIPVQVKGRLWGVIVVDSRRTRIDSTQDVYGLISKLLGRLWERI